MHSFISLLYIRGKLCDTRKSYFLSPLNLHNVQYFSYGYFTELGVSQTNNGASGASFHVTAGKMQHTVRNGAAHTASHLGPSTVGPRRLAFSFCSMSVKCSVPGVWSLRISALDSRTFCSFST